LCGYYAAAAAISICSNIDPTGAVYDEVILHDEVHKRIACMDQMQQSNMSSVDPIPFFKPSA
jgi:hypothetical protein